MNLTSLGIQGNPVTVNLLAPLTFLFILVTLFDPADKLLGIKVPLFITCWVVCIAMLLFLKRPIVIPSELFVYVLLMIAIPTISICLYFLVDGRQPFAGFLLIKSSLFVSFSIFLYLSRVNAFRILALGATLLGTAILLMTAYLKLFPESFRTLYDFGYEYGIYMIDQGRGYGGEKTFFQMYFVTSPMLVVSIAYYFFKWRSSPSHKHLNFLLLSINVLAMIIAGTRNNLIMAILLPISLFLLFSKRRLLAALFGCSFLFIISLAYFNEILAFFSPQEVSNSTKLTMLNDYLNIFQTSSLTTILLGSGLGSYHHWSNRGYNFVTELTYFELFRSYGFVMGTVMHVILVRPIVIAFLSKRNREVKALSLAYACYLIMSATNPLLFSSMGMMIFAVLIDLQCKVRDDLCKNHEREYIVDALGKSDGLEFCLTDDHRFDLHNHET